MQTSLKSLLLLALLSSGLAFAEPMTMMDATLMEMGDNAHEPSPYDALDDEEIEEVLLQETRPVPESSKTPTVNTKKLYYKEIIALTKKWRAQYPHDLEASKLQCTKKSIKYYCANSPVKNLSVLGRYELILGKLKSRIQIKKLDYLLPVLPCLMMRETGIFEPLIINGGNCDRSKFEGDPNFRITDQGLGQITRTTFFKILGLQDKEISSYLSGKLRISDEKAKSFRQLTSVHPFNTLTYRKNPLLMYNSLSNSIDYQLDVIIELLVWKREQVIQETGLASTDPELLRLTLEKYNGSDKKEKYANAVLACSTCLSGQFSSESKADPFACLGKSINKKILNSYPCKK